MRMTRLAAKLTLGGIHRNQERHLATVIDALANAHTILSYRKTISLTLYGAAYLHLLIKLTIVHILSLEQPIMVPRSRIILSTYKFNIAILF